MSRWFWTVLIAEALAFGAWHVLGLALASVVLFACYAVSCRLNPRVRHMSGWRNCGGSGEIKGWFFRKTFHRCPKCAGGRLIRPGARYIGADYVKAEHARGVAARAAAKQRREWRLPGGDSSVTFAVVFIPATPGRIYPAAMLRTWSADEPPSRQRLIPCRNPLCPTYPESHWAGTPVPAPERPPGLLVRLLARIWGTPPPVTRRRGVPH